MKILNNRILLSNILINITPLLICFLYIISDNWTDLINFLFTYNYINSSIIWWFIFTDNFIWLILLMFLIMVYNYFFILLLRSLFNFINNNLIINIVIISLILSIINAIKLGMLLSV